jgi:phospholipase C
LIESNITQWRRTVCGDLTSAFDFTNPNRTPAALPDTSAYMPLNHDKHPDYKPVPPTDQKLPPQEPGLRRARALPYEFRVDGNANVGSNSFRIDFKNTGKAGACFQVRSGNASEGPWTYTVEADKSLSNAWALAASQGKYDLSVFGPNGFLRQFRGVVARNAAADLDVDVSWDCDYYVIVLKITNQSHAPARVKIESVYDNKTIVDTLPRGRALEKRWPLKSSFGWYDLTVTTDADASFLRRIAGHLENDRDSVSDPAFGRGA